MKIAVLGGGLQGCCTALALAGRGVDVVLMDRNAGLLSRTAVANEGKIHLGYMYAADPSLETARTMMEGALAFAPFMQRHLGLAIDKHVTSEPAAYVVHRDSQHGVAEVTRYLASVHGLLIEASSGREKSYFGADLSVAPRRWSAGELSSRFDPIAAAAVYDTQEVAINPVSLAETIRQRIDGESRIEVRLATTVLSAEHRPDGTDIVSSDGQAQRRETFDHAVNALWDGRLAIDETAGLPPGRAWINRLKYGVSFTWPQGVESPPSATFISGPFGEVVSYPDRLTYLTWYPSCLSGLSSDIAPPDWQTYPEEPLHGEIVQGTFRALAAIVPALSAVKPDELPDVRVKGGVIVAWGDTDIYDPQSELHQRYRIGVNSVGTYHSIDPGKLTMAPYFADLCAERICGSF